MKGLLRGIACAALAVTFALGLVFTQTGIETRAAEDEITPGVAHELEFKAGETVTLTRNLKTNANEYGRYLIEVKGAMDIELIMYNTDGTQMVTYKNSNIRFVRFLYASNTYKITFKGYCNSSDQKKATVLVTYMDPDSPEVVKISEESFPDEAFRVYVKTYLDIDTDGSLNEIEIERTRELNFKGTRADQAIRDLTGIKYFKYLESLYYFYNRLTNLDVSGMKNLKSLEVTWSESMPEDLLSVNCSGCTALTVLSLQDNPELSDLNFQGCNKLEMLNVSSTDLASLNLTALTGLKELRCGGMEKITSLDLSKNINLEKIVCQNSKLSELDLTNNTKLVEVNVAFTDSNNGILSDIKLGYQPELKTLIVDQNSLTKIDVSMCPALEALHCTRNQLTALDVSNNSSLKILECSDNPFKKIYVPGPLDSLDIDSGVTCVVLTAKDWKFVDFTWKVDDSDPSNTNALANFICTKTGETSYKTSQNMILKTQIIKPTCEKNGVTEYLATLPADVSRTREKFTDKNSIETKALGHNWGDWTVTKKASIGKDGEETRICRNDTSHKQTRKIAALTPTPTAKPTKAASVTLKLDKSKADIVCGKDLTLKATVKGTKQAVTWKSSDSKIATVDSKGKITTKMAGAVTVTATVAGKTATCKVTILYKDVTNSKDFWFEPTNYLTAKGVVKGYDNQTKFKPANICTRAQMVTFIWRLQGEPKPKTTTCKFKDVKKTDYFYKACIWGNENHIVEGYKDGTFGPQINCARKHAVTFLWRLAGTPKPSSSKNKFKDVKKSDYFYTATLWASEKKILAGYDDGTFRPNGNCLRRQMVTFLYKYDKFVNGKG